MAVVVAAATLALLGMPPVDLHGPLHYLGIMDPLCGGTRSTYLSTHGHLREAMRYNPGAPLLLAAAVVTVVRAVVGWSVGRWLSIRVSRRILIPVVLIALAALEVDQQLHADLLTQPWTGP